MWFLIILKFPKGEKKTRTGTIRGVPDDDLRLRGNEPLS